MIHQAAFAALGDGMRLEIIKRLRRAPASVGELADGLPVSRPAVSQHLKVLKDAGLVVDVPDGTRRIYQINPEAFGAMREFLEPFWDEALAQFQAEVARRARKRRQR